MTLARGKIIFSRAAVGSRVFGLRSGKG
jgi:hypothetical protein